MGSSELALVTRAGISLEFRIHPGPIADWYISVVKTPGGLWNIDNSVSIMDLVAVATELSSLVNEPIDAWDQQQLNHWHREFEAQLTANNFSLRWQRVNSLIHHIESLRGSSTWLAVSRDCDIRQAIDPSLYPYWSHMQCVGDLCLGFNTIGKNLSACYIDQDQQQLAQGMVQTQKDLHSQALLTIARPDPLAHQRWAQRVQLWAQSIDHPQDLTQGLHQYHGCPLIARVIDLESMHKWHSAVQQGDGVSHWELG